MDRDVIELKAFLTLKASPGYLILIAIQQALLQQHLREHLEPRLPRLQIPRRRERFRQVRKHVVPFVRLLVGRKMDGEQFRSRPMPSVFGVRPLATKRSDPSITRSCRRSAEFLI